MNLIQIQENLKDLPTQAIMSYANGQNPQVPPYMALSELNRRKSMEQRAAQQPTASVKDQLEAAVTHQPPPGQPIPPGQPMPPGAPQMPQGPQGIAQLPSQAPQGQPQEQPPGAPPGMAGGGLAGLHVDDEMFNYAPGGIVAFAAGDLVEGYNPNASPSSDTGLDAVITDPSSDSALDETLRDSGPHRITKPQGAPTGLKSLEPQIAAILAKGMSGELASAEPRNPEVIRQEIMDKYPELAALVNKLPGSELKDLSKQLKDQNQANKDKFQEGQGRMGLAGLSQALIAAGEATRGHKGMAMGEALGGFGKSYANFTAEDVKRQQAQQAMERQQLIEVAKLDSEIGTLQQAYAKAMIDGRTADAANFEKQLADRQDKKQALQLGAAEKTGTLVNQNKELQNRSEQAAAALLELQQHHAAQKANWGAEAANRKQQLKIMEDTRSDQIDARARAKLDDAIKGDPRVQILAKRLNDKDNPVEIGSDQYNLIMDEVDKIRRQIIAEHPEMVVPDASGKPQYAQDAQGNVIVSYDNWKTNQPVKRPLTAGR